MEALYIQPWEEERVMVKEGEREKCGEQEEGGLEASSPVSSATDEETDEDSESEAPTTVRRKVSFADAFGLNLVSVKEFDNVEVAESDISLPPEREATGPLEEFYLSCLFTVPSSPEELNQRLHAQMVELETIELLRGTTTIRGTVRVVNLCYSKSVYARISLDRWTSYFDLLAEYVPGSSDRKTDRFSFKYTLVPPFEREGTRVEFCLRYETSVGTFWANNKEMNYVLFCHQRGHVNEPHVQEDSASCKRKRSCLKANRRGSAEEKTAETCDTSTVVAEAGATEKAEEAERKTKDRQAEIKSLLYRKERKPLVDSIKGRHRATRLARVQDYLSQQRLRVSKAHSHDSANGQKVPLPTPWGDSASFLHKRQKKQSSESQQVLTYHQIPLLTLDWNDSRAYQWGTAHMDDIWTERAKMILPQMSVENVEDTPSVNDLWDAFLNGTDDTADREISVCDVWQEFLNGPSCTDHSAVPESEWLQTATSVSPSNDKEPKTEYAASSQKHDFQVGTGLPTTLHERTSAACQLLSEKHETLLANVASNAADHQPAEASVSSPRDDNKATQDASQRSETNSETDTRQEFSLKGATPVSEGSVDSSTECREHAMWEQGKEGIIGGAGGIGGDELFTPHTAHFVTSSGDSETTDMTAKPESQNASAVDRISQGARLAEGLSSSREGQVTGTANNAMDDMLAFRGTIRQGTRDGERFAFSTSRQGEEEGIMIVNRMENNVFTGEETFGPEKTEECEISRRYADEKQCVEFRLNQNSENPLQENASVENETSPARSHADEFNPNQTCDGSFKQSQIMASKLKLRETENDDVTSNNEDSKVFTKTEVEPSYCTKSQETKGLIGAEEETIQVLNKEAWQHNEKALQVNSSWKREKTPVISEAHNKHSKPTQGEEQMRIQKEERDSTLTKTQKNGLKSERDPNVSASYEAKEGKSSSCDGRNEKGQETNSSEKTSNTIESVEMEKVFQRDHDTFRPFPTDNPKPLEVIGGKRTHSQDDLKGEKKTVGRKRSSEEITAKENVEKEDTSVELQQQPETLKRMEEDMSQRDKNERVSVGKLEIEALRESMGNVGIPQGDSKNAAAQLKEQESSAEVESSPLVEYKKLSEGTKDPITAENAVALDVIETGLEGTIIERFAEDLVQGIWEEVFDLRVPASNRDTNIVDGMPGKLADIPDITQDCHLLFEEDDDAFDSGVFSLTELPSDPNSSLCQGLEQTIADESVKYSPVERGQPLGTSDLSHLFLKSQTDEYSSANFSQDPPPDLAAQSGQSSTKSAQSTSKDLENYTQIKERPVVHQEIGGQTEERVVSRKESFNRSDHKHLTSSSEKSKESSSLVWWSMLYILSHITRLLVCVLLVVGFFSIIFMCDFPAFFALYMFSLSWWFYKWKSHRKAASKGLVG